MITQNLLSPILYSVNPSHAPLAPVTPIPSPPLNPNVSYVPTRGNDHYYIRIIQPELLQDNPGIGSLTYNIPEVGFSRGMLRLILPVSIGYGINTCYRVEFWKWSKPFVPSSYSGTISSKIIPTMTRYEYWWVPTVDRIHLLSYEHERVYGYGYPNPYGTQSVTITRGSGMTDDLSSHMDIISISSVVSGVTQYLPSDYNLIDNTIPPYISDQTITNPLLAPFTPGLAIDWSQSVTPAPVLGSTYTINYYTPLSNYDVIFHPDSENYKYPAAYPNTYFPYASGALFPY